MDKRNLNLLFQTMSLCNSLGGESASYPEFNLDDADYIMDLEIIDCQFKLYTSMLIDDEYEAKTRFEDFKVSYAKLSKDKQEYIMRDLRRVFEEQDKNNKEKEKKL